MSSIVIKNKSSKALTLNESESPQGKKYVFEGIFTQCGVENRNQRIYDRDEILPHLAYLRDKIKEEGCILGELDHPEGRFEVFIKEASHKITDLWYDTNENCVMGKLELLNTPNGKTIQAVVDAGCPLFVSSRAAGTVGADKHVSIQQIFTYDIVAVPGFAEARLDQVSESMRAQVTSFLNESKSAQEKSKNLAGDFGLDSESVEVFEASKDPDITAKKKHVSVEELSKPINEDIKVKITPEKARELGLVNDNGSAADAGTDDSQGQEEQHTADEILGIVPKYEGQDKDFVKDIQPEFKSPESGSDSQGASTADAQSQLNNTPNTQMQESKSGKKAYINLMNETKKEEPKSNKEEVKTKYDDEIDLNETGEDSTPNPIADGKKGSETDKAVDSEHKKEAKEEKGGNDDKVDQNATSKNNNAEKQSEIKESKKVSKNKKINESFNYESIFQSIIEDSNPKGYYVSTSLPGIIYFGTSQSLSFILETDIEKFDNEIGLAEGYWHDIKVFANGSDTGERISVDDLDENIQESIRDTYFEQIDKRTYDELISKGYVAGLIESSVVQDKNIQRLINKQNEIKESTDKTLGFYEDLLIGQDKIQKIHESIIQKWPFSISLSESNFEKFATLSPEDKDKCASFIWENQIFDIKQINETFMRPLKDAINEKKNYLRLADNSDVQLYMNAPDEIKESIDKQAALFILETKEDVDEFWRLTGLREAVARQVQNESFVESFNKQMAEKDNKADNEWMQSYGYDARFIEQVGKMM